MTYDLPPSLPPSTQSYLVCPYCYNEPPFKGKHKGMGCNMCPHQSCPHAMPLHSVDKCAECEYGIMVLEPRLQTGGPSPKWQISCNNAKCVSVCLLWWREGGREGLVWPLAYMYRAFHFLQQFFSRHITSTLLQNPKASSTANPYWVYQVCNCRLRKIL